MTRLKLTFVKLTIVVGVAVIAAWQWSAASHKNNFENESFNQGFVGQALLGVVMAGIPAILFAVLTYIALEWLLFRPGELEEFRARRRVAVISQGLGAQPKDQETQETPRHDYAD
jgi:signal transduction histidine kinase